MDELARESYQGIPVGLVETSRIPRSRPKQKLEDVGEVYPSEVAEPQPLTGEELLLQAIERGKARREASSINKQRIVNNNTEDMIYIPSYYRRRKNVPIVEESGIRLPTRKYLGYPLRQSSLGTGV